MAGIYQLYLGTTKYRTVNWKCEFQEIGTGSDKFACLERIQSYMPFGLDH